MNLVRTIRRSAQLGVRECAKRAGVAHARISEYETNRHEPTLTKLQEIAQVAGFHFVPVPVSGSTITAADVADEIYDLIFNKEPFRKQLRLVYQLNDDLNAAPQHVLGSLVVTPPPPTGDQRFDALIAGLVEWQIKRRKLPLPPWVNEPHRRVEEVWQVDKHTDPSDAVRVIARHGVLIGHAELESV